MTKRRALGLFHHSRADDTEPDSPPSDDIFFCGKCHAENPRIEDEEKVRDAYDEMLIALQLENPGVAFPAFDELCELCDDCWETLGFDELLPTRHGHTLH